LFAAEPAAATSELNFTGNWTATENQQPNIAAKKIPIHGQKQRHLSLVPNIQISLSLCTIFDLEPECRTTE